MDSITQFTLGAAVGQVVLSKRMGRSATLLGGLAGTIPDLDSLFLRHADMVTRLVHHRGLSHSLLFCALAPLLLALACRLIAALTVNKHQQHNHIAWTRWYVFWFLAFFTHMLIDAFTSWGTQVFWPSSHKVALNSIYIIDPLYTIPLLIGVLTTLTNKQLKPVCIGLGISSLYLCTLLGIKVFVGHQFEKGLSQQGIRYTSYITKPTPFNGILWSITADAGDHYVYGYYSIFDDTLPKTFSTSGPKNHHLLSPYQRNTTLQQLLHFTRGYYLAQKDSQGNIIIQDARYGRFGSWSSDTKGVYIFTYKFNPRNNTYTHTRPPLNHTGKRLQQLFKRF